MEEEEAALALPLAGTAEGAVETASQSDTYQHVYLPDSSVSTVNVAMGESPAELLAVTEML